MSNSSSRHVSSLYHHSITTYLSTEAKIDAQNYPRTRRVPVYPGYPSRYQYPTGRVRSGLQNSSVPVCGGYSKGPTSTCSLMIDLFSFCICVSPILFIVGLLRREHCLLCVLYVPNRKAWHHCQPPTRLCTVVVVCELDHARHQAAPRSLFYQLRAVQAVRRVYCGRICANNRLSLLSAVATSGSP